jgi:vacuolar-type H+-ATPase subunit C/Vma6
VSRAARRAFGYARVRAARSRLLTAAEAGALLRGESRRASPGVPLAPLAAAHTARSVVAAALASRYDLVSRGYPEARPLWLSLLRVREIENVKLLWRAAVRARPERAWRPYWTDVGRLAAVAPDHAASPLSLYTLVARLRATPYGGIAEQAMRAHAEDPLAGELAFDRWATGRLVEEALRLPTSDRLARRLALAVAREREAQILRRALRSFAIPTDLVAGVAPLLAREIGAARLRALAEWGPARGPIGRLVPGDWVEGTAGIDDWPDLELAMRRNRHRLCRVAFRSDPFSLAPPLALLILAEAEARSVLSIVEIRESRAPSSALAPLVAASAMGA